MFSLRAISAYLPGLVIIAVMVLIVIILYNFRGRKKAEKGLKEYDPQGDVMTWNEGAEQMKSALDKERELNEMKSRFVTLAYRNTGGRAGILIRDMIFIS
jgi:hypothetical protein